MSMMFDDPLTHEIAAQTAWEYQDVHEALRALAQSGADVPTARQLLLRAAEEGVHFAQHVAYAYAQHVGYNPWFQAPRPQLTIEDELDQLRTELERE